MKYLLIIFITFFLTNKVDACTCFAPKIEVDFERSDVVFKGKVISVKVDSNIHFTEHSFRNKHPNIYTFLVEEKWKGYVPSIIQVVSRDVGFSCDDHFWLDSTYIVFAKGERIYASACSHTRIISRAQEEIKFLGEGKKVELSDSERETIKYIREGPKKSNIQWNEPKKEFQYKYLIIGFIGLVILIITFYLGRLSRKP